VKSICDRLLKKDAEIDLMFCCIKPKATSTMQEAFKTHYDAKKDETGKAFTTIQLFDDKQHETQSFHFVFVLDESGSMSGEWNALQNAYKAFLNRRNDDQGGDDHFTVVQFDSSARIICQQQRLANTPRTLQMNGGGTDYCAGLNTAKTAIATDTTRSSIVMIFMSDGGDGSGKDPVALVRQLKVTYTNNHNFVCHTVGFGSGIAQGSSAAQLLANMASVGGGQAYSALTGAELQTVFNRIAANSTTSDALVERFSTILAREISVKIMVDYL
jgi:Mg-chelatase subunit ChlD